MFLVFIFISFSFITPVFAFSSDFFTGEIQDIKSKYVYLPSGIFYIESSLLVKDVQTGFTRRITVPAGKIGNVAIRPANMPLPRKKVVYFFEVSGTKSNIHSDVLKYYEVKSSGSFKRQISCGYVRERNKYGTLLWWQYKCIEIHPSNDASELLSGLLEAGFERWNSVLSDNSSLSLSEGEPEDFSFLSESNSNIITFLKDGWAWGRDSEAITLLTYIEDDSFSTDGMILDADIFINLENYSYDFNNSIDLNHLKLIVAHEIGHVLGLDHPCDNPSIPETPSCFDPNLSENIKTSIMYPYSNAGNEFPNSCDAEGVREMFPLDDERLCKSVICGGGGCATSPSGSEIPTWFLTVSALIFLLLIGKFRKHED